MNANPSRLIITGGRGSGKTSFCIYLTYLLNTAGWDVAGILSQPVFQQSLQIAIDAINLQTGIRRCLATLNLDKSTSEVQTERWVFDTSTVAWCNEVFRSAIPCDLLVVDELGPLEFERDQGWTDALTALDSGKFKYALAVVRTELLTLAQERWPTARLIKVTNPENIVSQASKVVAEIIRDERLLRRKGKQ